LALIARAVEGNLRTGIIAEINDSLTGDAYEIALCLRGLTLGSQEVHRAAAAQLADWAKRLAARAEKREKDARESLWRQIALLQPEDQRWLLEKLKRQVR
jgi:hypothetical protein